jgi:uncharacterized protein (TIGR04255 family)
MTSKENMVRPVRAVTEKLKHPAIVEAVCEIRFATALSYTMIPGAMRERLRAKFPTVEVLPAAMLMGAVPEDLIPSPVPYHRFKSDFPNATVQTGPKVLTVNILPKYPSYEIFRELILFALEQYRDVAQPGKPVRVGLRYINHLPVDQDETDISNYVKFRLSYPESLHHPPQESLARLLLPYGDLGTLGVAVSFPARVGQSGLGTLLDLDFFANDPSDIDLDTIVDWLDQAHDILYTGFTSIVADRVMNRMKGS